MPTPTSTPALAERGVGARAALLAAVAVALALRIWEAWESSLWLDELHTLSHASQPNLAALLEAVELERVHVPLFFAFTQLFGGWEEGASLRWIPILASLCTLVPLLALTREVVARSSSVVVAAWLFACLPYHVHWGAELRPYACWAFFSACAAWAAFSERRSLALRTAVFFLCALAGIWTHRLMAVSVFSIGVARLFVRGPSLVPLWRLIVCGALAFAPMALWVVSFAEHATTTRLEYQEAHRGFELRPALIQEFLALPLRLAAPFLGALGGVWALLAKAGVVLLVATLGAALFARRASRAPRIESLTLRGLIVFALAHYAVVVVIAWWTWDRLPLQYFAPVAWALPVLVAALFDRLEGRARWLGAVLCAAALVLGIAQAGGRSVEDMRGAVERARALGAKLERPLYSALLSQPSLFEHVLPYRAYGRELEFREPDELPAPGSADFARPIVLLRRGQIAVGTEGWAPVLGGRRIVDEQHVDGYLTLFVLEPAP